MISGISPWYQICALRASTTKQVLFRSTHCWCSKCMFGITVLDRSTCLLYCVILFEMFGINNAILKSTCFYASSFSRKKTTIYLLFLVGICGNAQNSCQGWFFLVMICVSFPMQSKRDKSVGTVMTGNMNSGLLMEGIH